MKSVALSLLALALLSTVHAQSVNRDSHFFDTAGLRGGIDSDNDVSIDGYEVFATVPTGYEWKLGKQTTLKLKFEGAVGALIHSDDDSIYARIGPQFVISSENCPFSLVASSGPAYLTDHTFGGFDLGGNFQFITSIGIDCKINDNWSLGYRWNHISNAGIHSKNPGLNLHTIGLSYKF